jgi:hypothetical protein
MSLNTKLLVFSAKTLVLLVLIYPLWSVLTPLYNGFVAEVSNSFISITGKASGIVLIPEGHFIWIDEFETEPKAVMQRIDVNKVYFNLILLIALFLATPSLGLQGRLKLLFAGLAVLFIAHVFSVVIIARDVQGGILRQAQRFLITMGFQLFPILIWAMLTYKCWSFRPEENEY